MAWDSKQYLKFSDERKQPCLDLISRLNDEYKSILDLGCGPGNSTKNLHNKFKNADIIGFDSDDNMLKRAKDEHPDFEFVKGFAPNDFNKTNKKFDLVFSNACIHWIENQIELIDGVYEMLNDNGTFAVQIPLTNESHFYKILNTLIDEKYSKLKCVHIFHNLDQSGYYNELIKRFKSVTIWQSNYYHTVKKESVIEWYKGSGLKPYLDILNESEKNKFLNDLQSIIDKEYAVLNDGNVFLIMPRLFFIAKK